MIRTTDCLACHTPIEQPATGRKRRYCSSACKQQVYRQRRAKRRAARYT